MAVRLNLKQNISMYENTKTALKRNTHSEMETHDYEDIPDENEMRKKDPHEYLILDDKIHKTTNAQNDHTFEPIISTLQDKMIYDKHVTVKWKVATLITILLCVGLTSGLVAVLVVWLSARVSPCSEGRCLYSGTCNVVEDKAVCTCVKGFNGTRCETTPCSTSSCQNEGTCFIHQLLPRCACGTGFIGANCEIKFPTQDCSDLNSTEHKSGVYVIQPKGSEMFSVYCNMDTDGGGWTVFQKRFNGETDFFRGWNDYKEGFGYPKAEYWLGNSKLALMTSQRQYELRIDLEDLNGATAYARYSTFSIGNESTNYKLTIGGYSGTAGDSLKHHNNMAFSTEDRDNDVHSMNCAVLYKGAWWYNNCYYSNLNGLYQGNESEQTGMAWFHWKNDRKTMKTTTMMIRRKIT